MSLYSFLNNEIEISKFKLKNLDDLKRPYKIRLAEIEREFLQIDFTKLVGSESEARDAVRLFRLSRPMFYSKYRKVSESIKNFPLLKEVTLNRKRFIIKKIDKLLSGDMGGYEDEVSNFFSYSDIIKKRQILRFYYGVKSLGMHCKLRMKKVHEEIKSLDNSNVLYAKSLIDRLIEELSENWYSNYNEALSDDPDVKLKKIRVILNKDISREDLTDDGYLFVTNIKKLGNEHSKIVHLDVVDESGNDIKRYFRPSLCGASGSNFKLLKLLRLNDESKNINANRVKLITASTRSESISIESLMPFVNSFCCSISKEYHLL